ncbi:armadillo-type protein [Zopfochytrium polystomum]|nr:armadillo-type protein [Zopfochytrium polystomum]
MEGWQPDPHVQEELAEALSAENSEQIAFINKFTQDVDNFRYLFFAMVRPELPIVARNAASGFILYAIRGNNQIALNLAQRSDLVLFFRQCIYADHGDKDLSIANAATISVIRLLVQREIKCAPDLLLVLLYFTGCPSTSIGTALDCWTLIRVICDQAVPVISEHPLMNEIIVALIQHKDHDNPDLSTPAIQSVNCFVMAMSCPAMVQNIPGYINRLIQQSHCPDGQLVSLVCESVALITEKLHKKIADDLLDKIISVIMRCCDATDNAVARSACEFWITFADCGDERFYDLVGLHLEQLLPILLKNMSLTEDDMKARRFAVEAKDTPETALAFRSDIQASTERPHPHRSSTEDDDDDDADLADDSNMGWNLRKCAAASLDAIASAFGDQLVPHLLPPLKAALSSDDWIQREAGILALGAVAVGCARGLEVYLGELVKFLWVCLGDPRPIIRAMASWTLSRFSQWIVHGLAINNGPRQDPHYFDHSLCRLAELVLDKNSEVSRSACTALATLVEAAGDALGPHLSTVVHSVNAAFGQILDSNVGFLCDLVVTLADAAGGKLNNRDYVPLLMQPLLVQLDRQLAARSDISVLFDCLRSVALAAGASFKPFAGRVWAAGWRVLVGEMPNVQAGSSDMSLTVAALDLLQGLVQSLGADAAEWVDGCAPPLASLIAECTDPRMAQADVRQSAFALLGDVAGAHYSAVDRPQQRPRYLPRLVAHALAHTRDLAFLARRGGGADKSAANNAVWALGVLAQHMPPRSSSSAVEQDDAEEDEKDEEEEGVADVTGVVAAVCGELARTVCVGRDECQSGGWVVVENAAVTMARLGAACPAAVAEAAWGSGGGEGGVGVARVVAGWCGAVRGLKERDEMESATSGMLRVVRETATTSGSGLVSCLQPVCELIAGWAADEAAPNATRDEFQARLLGAERWEAAVAGFPESLTLSLQDDAHIDC